MIVRVAATAEHLALLAWLLGPEVGEEDVNNFFWAEGTVGGFKKLALAQCQSRFAS